MKDVGTVLIDGSCLGLGEWDSVPVVHSQFPSCLYLEFTDNLPTVSVAVHLALVPSVATVAGAGCSDMKNN